MILCSLQIGDLVLCKVNPTGDVKKLAPRWEGSFKVVHKVVGGAYYFQDVE